MAILNMVYGGGGSSIKIPLDAISDLAAAKGNAKATITWTDPNDKTYDGITLVAWSKTILVRKVGSAPTSASDGTVVLTSTVKNQYSSTGYEDTGLTNGTTYYYAAFAIGDNGTSVISNTPSVKPVAYQTYTITWNETSDPSQFFVSYSDDATGMTQGSSDFDTFFGYYGCRLSSAGVETATVAQSSPGVLNISSLGTLTSGDNVMIAFPRRGIKMTKSGTQVTLSITDDPNKDGYQYYAHTKGSSDKDVLYIGAYKMVSGYKSLSGAAPLVNLTRDGFRSGVKTTYDSSAGTNRYSQISIYARWLINAYYMLKYGNPDSQTVIGQGYTGGSAAINTGGTNSQTPASYGTSSTTTQAKLFGLEDWWGNVFEWMDCCWFNASTQLTVDKTNSVFQDSDYSTNLGTASSGWLAGIDGSSDGMFRNVNTSGGSGTTYYADYSNAGASRVLFAGGGWYYGTDAGAFCVYNTGASDAGAYGGARLMFL